MADDFNNLPTTKLGNIGEGFISEFCRAKKARSYGPSMDGSNPVDSFCINESLRVFGIEVKTKARLSMENATGYDEDDHKKYLAMDVPVYILFVDYLYRKIYGQWVKKLDKVKQSFADGLLIFPLEEMEIYRELTKDEIKELSEASNSNYE